MFNNADFYCELPKLGVSLAVKSPQSSGFQNKQLSLELSVARDVSRQKKECFASC